LILQFEENLRIITSILGQLLVGRNFAHLKLDLGDEIM